MTVQSVVASTWPDARPEPRKPALPSWRDGDARREIVDFLATTTTHGSPDFVAETGRTAVFDNDGTLWSERPLTPELVFSLARVRELAPHHPEWADEEPFRSALAGDVETLAHGGIPALIELAKATQGGVTPEAFRSMGCAWLDEARHPRFGRPYRKLTFRPMLEVMQLFEEHGFRCFVVSAGGLEFLRAWTLDAYGLPPNRLIGSVLELDYVVEDGRADLRQATRVESFTNGPSKPEAIANVIGQRPLAAFGNSDGDYEMLQYVTTGPGRRLGMLVRHDDGEREYAYDRDGGLGRLDRALDDAEINGWSLISMKDDWESVFGA